MFVPAQTFVELLCIVCNETLFQVQDVDDQCTQHDIYPSFAFCLKIHRDYCD